MNQQAFQLLKVNLYCAFITQLNKDLQCGIPVNTPKDELLEKVLAVLENADIPAALYRADVAEKDSLQARDTKDLARMIIQRVAEKVMWRHNFSRHGN